MSDAKQCLILFLLKETSWKKPSSSHHVLCVFAETVPYAFPRSLSWELRGQQECYDILVSAWNSAGEGPKGKPATCCCHSKLSDKTGSDKTTGAFPFKINEKDH